MWNLLSLESSNNEKFMNLSWWTVPDSKIFRFVRICHCCIGRNTNYFGLKLCRIVEYGIVNIWDFFFETSKYRVQKNSALIPPSNSFRIQPLSLHFCSAPNSVCRRCHQAQPNSRSCVLIPPSTAHKWRKHKSYKDRLINLSIMLN